MLEIDTLVYFIHKILHIHLVYNWKLWWMLSFDSNWACSWAWGLSVLVGHPHHSLKLNPNGFLYPMPNPPTQPCWTLHHQFPLLRIAYIFQRAILHFQLSKRKWDFPIHLLLLSFFISHIQDLGQNWHSVVQVKSYTSSSFFMWFGDQISLHLRSPHNSSCGPHWLFS